MAQVLPTWRCPKIGVPPVIIYFTRIFHDKSSIWGTPILGNRHIAGFRTYSGHQFPLKVRHHRLDSPSGVHRLTESCRGVTSQHPHQRKEEHHGLQKAWATFSGWGYHTNMLGCFHVIHTTKYCFVFLAKSTISIRWYHQNPPFQLLVVPKKLFATKIYFCCFFGQGAMIVSSPMLRHSHISLPT